MWNPFSSRRKCSRKLSSYDSPLFSLEFIVSSKKQYFSPPSENSKEFSKNYPVREKKTFFQKDPTSRATQQKKKKKFPSLLPFPSFVHKGRGGKERALLLAKSVFPSRARETWPVSSSRGRERGERRLKTRVSMEDDALSPRRSLSLPSLHELPTAKPSVLIIDDDLQGWKKLWNPLPHHHHRCRRFRASWHVSLHPRVIQILALECSGPASKVFSIRLSTRTPFIFSRVALPLSLFLLSAGNRARFSPWSPSFSPLCFLPLSLWNIFSARVRTSQEIRDDF